jgi:DNA helicase IV
MPSVASISGERRALNLFSREVIADLLKSPRLATLIATWFPKYVAPYRNVFSFKSLREYYDYIRAFEGRTLKGEFVKSFEECEIANIFA